MNLPNLDKWICRLTDRVNRVFSKLIFFCIRGEPAVFASQKFPWTAFLEANWRNIRRELDEVLTRKGDIPDFQNVSSLQDVLTRDDKWKAYFFFVYGREITKNCKRCPMTAALLKKIPGMKTAMFSIMEGKKYVPSHKGPYRGVLRYHLGLMIPKPRELCRIRIAGETLYWEEGKSLIFDDCNSHEVWNDSAETRVVLFVDFKRPLPFPVSLMNEIMIHLISRTSYVREMLENA